ncbi:MAG: SusD/RagB family nutrient-binding outer membrane lipoprotein [Thermonemataceae bacterium]|nr:SusD/RagB family nutrient-binding outer membrane lipoprotein [Thermonemataceae bacterium]
MKKVIYSILALSLFFTWGCKKGYLDINQNPNQPTSAQPEQILPTALNNTAGRWTHREMGAFWMGQWAPSGSVSGFTAEKTYNPASNYRTAIWSGIYDNLKDYDFVEKEAEKSGKDALRGIAKIMKVYNYQILVDTYGNVPYTEALQGTDVIRPTYDKAEDIYDDFIVQLDTAIALLKKPESSINVFPRSSDIVFGGDATKWVKFANTMKIKVLLRHANNSAKAAYIQTNVDNIVAEGSGFITENVLSNPGYLQSDGKLNQFWATYFKDAAGTNVTAVSFYAVGAYFKTMLDGRETIGEYRGRGGFYSATASLEGVTLGQLDAPLYANCSKFNEEGLFLCQSFNQDSYLMSAAESFFLQAEAAERGYLADDAQMLYNKGVEASFVENYIPGGYTGAASDAAAYVSNGEEVSDYADAPDKIELIITQKYIAGFGHGAFEAWCDYRRTGFPNPTALDGTGDIFYSPQSIFGKSIPARLLYPSTEEQTNSANALAEGITNVHTQKLFWAK